MANALTPTEYYNLSAEIIQEVLADYIHVVRCKRCLFYDKKTSECKEAVRTGTTFVVNEDFYCGDGVGI